MADDVSQTPSPPPPVGRDSLRLAAIDVGSNSIHMVIAQADADGGMTALWRMKEMVGLGRISFPSKNLSDEAIERAVGALSRFALAARQRQCEKIITVATSAIREADNGGAFVERAKRETGLFVRVVSAREEARLIYLAVRHALPLEGEAALIVDIGGGSVEFIVGDGRRAGLLESRKLGAARMTARFVHGDPIDDADRKALLAHYDSQLRPLARQILAAKPARVVATSGTMENLAAMCGSTGRDGIVTIERARLDKLVNQLVKSTSAQRADIPGLDGQRRDQIVAGALLARDLFERLDIPSMRMCGAALREGILLDYLSRHLPDLAIRREVPDPRRRSVLDLGRRCGWNRDHARRVADLCLQLFDQLQPHHELGPIERELIEYGAMLHDIGLHIDRQGHHRHGEYLILHGKLKQFTREQVRIIAAIARYHRGKRPKPRHKSVNGLSDRSRFVVEAGAALLRIADGLDRSHSDVVRAVRCKVSRGKVRCQVEAKSDAELEIWGAANNAGLFERVFHRKFQVVPAGAAHRAAKAPRGATE